MNSTLSVTEPATDLALLTIEELRAAVGVADSSKDDLLTTLGKRVSDRITQACKVRAAGATPPTLREETLSETFRIGFGLRGSRHGAGSDTTTVPYELVLARRPIVSVSSIDEDGVTLEAADYLIDAGAGTIGRLRDDRPSGWFAAKVTVDYVAGWADIPESLKAAAEQLVRDYWFQGARDQAVSEIEIPGVIRRRYWVGSSSDPDISQEIIDMLAPYRNPVVG